MNLNNTGKLKPALYKFLTLICVSIFLPYGMNYFFDSRETFGLQAAAATTQYGILGHQAPELYLNTWIDGSGNPMDPLKLKDYRGKVIFLYFFQDW
jgi:hypothetical protein